MENTEETKLNTNEKTENKMFSGNCGPGIDVSRDNIFFYTQVDDDSALRLNRTLLDMAYNHLQYTVGGMLSRTQAAPIWLHINSNGGSITAGLSIVDTILHIIKAGVPVATIVEGCACSAATFISIVGSTRFIRSNSYMLVHQLSSVAWGQFNQLDDDHANNVQFMKHIKSLYGQFTKIPEEEIDEILKHDLYWDAKKAKKYGLVDSII